MGEDHTWNELFSKVVVKKGDAKSCPQNWSNMERE
jgi:hypothetical protein